MKTALAALALAATATPTIVMPPPGSALRKAVLNGLRPVIEKRLGLGVEFVITVIRVQGEWAFVVADPQRKGGKPINGRRIFGEGFEEMNGLVIDAVLRKQGGRWMVVDHTIGIDHVWYCDVGPASLKANC